MFFLCFFFNDTATTEIYTLSLHDALPIFRVRGGAGEGGAVPGALVYAGGLAVPVERRPLRPPTGDEDGGRRDRKSTRLNSSHANISYAVFCLKKKKK